MKHIHNLLTLPVIISFSISYSSFIASSDTIYLPYKVSPQGVDAAEIDGRSTPWREISYALSRIPESGSATLLVEPGTYSFIRTTRRFTNPVLVRSSHPHQALIQPGTGQGPVLMIGARNLILDGFSIDNQNNPTISNALHILGGSSDITIRNCKITHGSSGYRNADCLKISRDVHDVLIDRNVIYDSMDEGVELSDQVHDVIFQHNVLYQSSLRAEKTIMALYDSVWDIYIQGNLWVFPNHPTDFHAIQIGRLFDSEQTVSTIYIEQNIFAFSWQPAAFLFRRAEKIHIKNNVFFASTPQETSTTTASEFSRDNQQLPHKTLLEIRKIFHASLPSTWLEKTKKMLLHR